MRIDRTEVLAGTGLFVLIVLAASVYWPGLSGGLVLDDFENLRPLEALDSGKMAWREVVTQNNSSPVGRPVAMLSFVANWLTTGGEVWHFKYTNLIVHLLCGTLIFWLSGRLLQEPVAGVGRARWVIALWVTSAWLFSPLLVSTVLYVVQRMAQLSALFVLAGLLSYVVGRQNLERCFVRGVSMILLGFLLFLPLAVLSKENGALLPLLALTVEGFFFQFKGSRAARVFIIGVFVLFLLLPMMAAITKIVFDPDWVTAGYAYREFTLGERVLTQARALADYVSNLLAPDGAGMGVFQDDYPKSESLFSPISTLLCIVGWLLVIVAAWWYRGTGARILFFGPVFFLAGHALESTIFNLELYFEHRNYLPSFGIFLAAGVGAYHVFRLLSYKLLAILVLTLIPVGYAAACYQRVLIWQSPVSLLLATEQAHPESPRVQTELASLYANSKQLSRALDHLERAEVLSGQTRSSGVALHRLLAYCVADTPYPDAEYARLKAIRKFDDDNYTANALRLLARSVQKGWCAEIDERTLATILHDWWKSTEGGNANRTWNLHLHTAQLLGHAGRKINALAHLESAWRLYPERLGPGLVAFQYQLQLGDLEGARHTLQELKRRDDKKLYRYTEAIHSFDKLIATADEAARQAQAVRPPL